MNRSRLKRPSIGRTLSIGALNAVLVGSLAGGLSLLGATGASAAAGSLTLDKRLAPNGLVDTNGNGRTDAGDSLTYEFEAKNIGDVPLRRLTVTDRKLEAAGVTVSCPAAKLAPGASTVCTASGAYTVTQADVDGGAVVNSASASAVAPAGNDPTAGTDTLITVTANTRAVDLETTADTDTLVAGETVTFTYTATNTGDVTLHDAEIELGDFTGKGELSDPTCQPAAPADLAPGAQLVCTATYTVRAADVRAGSIESPFTVTGTSPDGDQVVDSGSVRVSGGGKTAWKLDKRVSRYDDVDHDGTPNAGDTLVYEFAVRNTGRTNLTGLTITDPKLAAAGITITCAETSLAPRQSTVCTSSSAYTMTQLDVDSGGVNNTATANATATSRGAVVRQHVTDSAITPAG